MKKILVFVLVLSLVSVCFVACGKNDEKEESDVKSEGVMTYAEYIAAAADSKVVVETYIQDKQGWWENNGVGVATFYTQDKDGAYFLYNLPCSKEDYDNKLTKGTKIKVTGYKSVWDGEVEIIDGTYEVISGKTYVAPALDATSLLGKDDIAKHMNEFVSFKCVTVEASKDANGNDVAFLYKWDGSGNQGDDIYFNVSYEGKTYSFTVESYLRGADTEVYKAVEGLKIGDKIDVEGFLYWYATAPQPHVISVKASK